jgi:hypothetical protein
VNEGIPALTFLTADDFFAATIFIAPGFTIFHARFVNRHPAYKITVSARRRQLVYKPAEPEIVAALDAGY